MRTWPKRRRWRVLPADRPMSPGVVLALHPCAAPPSCSDACEPGQDTSKGELPLHEDAEDAEEDGAWRALQLDRIQSSGAPTRSHSPAPGSTCAHSRGEEAGRDHSASSSTPAPPERQGPSGQPCGGAVKLHTDLHQPDSPGIAAVYPALAAAAWQSANGKKVCAWGLRLSPGWALLPSPDRGLRRAPVVQHAAPRLFS